MTPTLPRASDANGRRVMRPAHTAQGPQQGDGMRYTWANIKDAPEGMYDLYSEYDGVIARISLRVAKSVLTCRDYLVPA